MIYGGYILLAGKLRSPEETAFLDYEETAREGKRVSRWTGIYP